MRYIFIFALALLAVPPLQADPILSFGDYIGTLRTTKTLAPGSPSVVTSVRLVARVTDGGVITLLPAIPQSVTQGVEPESAVSRIAPDAKGIYHLDGLHEVAVTFDGSLLRIRIVNAPQEDPNLGFGGAVGPRSTIEATLRLVTYQPPSRR